MKRLFFLSAILLGMFSFSSCRKDFTCTCSKIYKNNSSDNIRDYSHKTYRDSRSGAESKCNEHIGSGSDDTGNYSLNCQIEC